MIHHISLAANNPLHVAQVLAELWQADAMPFPEHEGGYVVLTYDAHGTLIVILPKGTEMIPGLGDAESTINYNPYASAYTATHAAISVPVSEAQIWEIAARENWRVMHCNRAGIFEIIELWVENQFLIELLPPTLVNQYTNAMQPEVFKQFLQHSDE